MNCLFLILSYTPSMIVLMEEGALMYDKKDCKPIPKAEGCYECHTSKPQWQKYTIKEGV